MMQTVETSDMGLRESKEENPFAGSLKLFAALSWLLLSSACIHILGHNPCKPLPSECSGALHPPPDTLVQETLQRAVNDVRNDLEHGRLRGDPSVLREPVGVIWQSCWFYTPASGKRGAKRCSSSAIASDGRHVRISTANPEQVLPLVYKEARNLALQRLDATIRAETPVIRNETLARGKQRRSGS